VPHVLIFFATGCFFKTGQRRLHGCIRLLVPRLSSEAQPTVAALGTGVLGVLRLVD
jgi:hypothetical protein